MSLCRHNSDYGKILELTTGEVSTSLIHKKVSSSLGSLVFTKTFAFQPPGYFFSSPSFWGTQARESPGVPGRRQRCDRCSKR